jgi:hypothetical protein
MDRLERDGKVAVLVSSGYGSGWSSWAELKDQEFLTMNKELAEAVERSDYLEVERIVNEKDINIYVDNFTNLKIEWVNRGTRFFINEYDGDETIRLLDEVEYLTA